MKISLNTMYSLLTKNGTVDAYNEEYRVEQAKGRSLIKSCDLRSYVTACTLELKNLHVWIYAELEMGYVNKVFVSNYKSISLFTTQDEMLDHAISLDRNFCRSFEEMVNMINR